MDTQTVSGFDMAPTIAWYYRNIAEIQRRLPPPIVRRPPSPSFTVVGIDDSRGDFTLEHIQALLWLFPAAARDRMVMDQVAFGPSTWFHRNTTMDNIIPTTDVGEALSPTAVAPSKVDVTREDNWCGFKMTPRVFYIADGLMPDAVRRVIYLQAFTHELAHTLANPEVWGRTSVSLRGQDGVVKSQLEFINEFEAQFNSAPPISHYASAYFDRELGRLPDNSLTGICESMAEAITAYLLGFAFRTDGSGLNPFVGREALHELLSWYLLAARTTVV